MWVRFPGDVTEDAQITRRAAAGRDGARARVRRVTGGVLVGAVALAGTVVSYVAHGGAHKKSFQPAASTAAVVRRTTTQVPVPAKPAAPSLQASGQSAAQPSQSASPAQAPSQTQAPPVAVSGGS
jgi:hypothetical protein